MLSILPQLWIGTRETANDINFFKTNNIRAVINISYDIPNYINYVNYLNIKLSYDDLRSDIIKKNIYIASNNFIYDSYKSNIGILIHGDKDYYVCLLLIGFFMIEYMDVLPVDIINYYKFLLKDKLDIIKAKELKIYFELYNSVKK
jgi:hypothetical protein